MPSHIDPAVELLARLEAPGAKQTPPLLMQAMSSGGAGSILDVFEAVATRNERPAPTSTARNRFAGLVVGAMAEHEFQDRYEQAMAGQEFSFEDQIAAATETDLLVRNGYGRAAFRINIKAHGTRFEQAKRFVGMDPEDTFALATYKIRDALNKSQQERLPFLFAIVSSSALAAAPVGERLPSEIRHLLDTSTLFKGLVGWRAIENGLVDHVFNDTSVATADVLTDLRAAVRQAEWRVISAQRAFRLMTERLWDRVPAVAKRNFSGNAASQPNMHFSLAEDMIGLDDLLDRLASFGIQHVATAIAFQEI